MRISWVNATYNKDYCICYHDLNMTKYLEYPEQYSEGEIEELNLSANVFSGRF